MRNLSRGVVATLGLALILGIAWYIDYERNGGAEPYGDRPFQAGSRLCSTHGGPTPNLLADGELGFALPCKDGTTVRYTLNPNGSALEY